jgi:hypothetical protein
MFERISSGYIPLMKFNTSKSSGCYLFECKRHNHQEYQRLMNLRKQIPHYSLDGDMLGYLTERVR